MHSGSRIIGLASLALLSACTDDQPLRASDAGLTPGAHTDDAGLDEPDDARADELTTVEATADAEPEQTLVTLRFKGMVGDHDYACGESYPAQGASKLTVRGRAFRFFVHDLRLIDAAGVEVPLVLEERAPAQTGALALLDFDNADGRCAGLGDTNNLVTGHAAPGEYRGIAFSVGVPEELNHGDPGLASAPLRGSGMAWNWVQGYRFLVAELEAAEPRDGGTASASDGVGDAASSDADAGQQEQSAPGLGVLHIGSTGCTGSPAKGISCAKPNRAHVRLSSFDPETNSIVADLGALFADVDLAQGAQCHARGEVCSAMFTALGVDLESGGALESQSFFRVE